MVGVIGLQYIVIHSPLIFRFHLNPRTRIDETSFSCSKRDLQIRHRNYLPGIKEYFPNEIPSDDIQLFSEKALGTAP